MQGYKNSGIEWIGSIPSDCDPMAEGRKAS